MSKKPSSWVLDSEPDLTPDQVWGIYAWGGQAGCRVAREGVVIADSTQQAIDAVKLSQWTPVAVMNESALNHMLAHVEGAHVVRNIFGQAGSECFLLVFGIDEPGPLRVHWVRASSEAAARSTWPDLGESQAPKAVIPIALLTAMRDRVRQVRLDRGEGAMSDGRHFENPDARWYALEAQCRPGGQEALNAQIEKLHALRLRVQAKHEARSNP
jgi:hypothetical protein